MQIEKMTSKLCRDPQAGDNRFLHEHLLDGLLRITVRSTAWLFSIHCSAAYAIIEIIPTRKRATAQAGTHQTQGSQEWRCCRRSFPPSLRGQFAGPLDSRAARASLCHVRHDYLGPAHGAACGFGPIRAAVASGMNSYLNGLPEPLYALFGTATSLHGGPQWARSPAPTADGAQNAV